MSRKIAFISEHASPLALLGGTDSGGQNVYVTELAKQLAKDGYEIDIYTRKDFEKLPEIVQMFPGVRVVHVMAGPPHSIPKEQLLPHMHDFSLNMNAFIQREKINYQLIHANFWMSALVGLELKNLYHIPLVVTFHALGKIRRLHLKDKDAFPEERVALEERIVQEADCIIAECPQDKKDLIHLYKAHPGKLAVVPCGVNPLEFYPIDRSYARMCLGLDQDEKIILQLGRMVQRKGVDNVIRSLKYLEPKIPFRLLVVGGDQDESQYQHNPELIRLKKLVASLGLQDRVNFIGPKRREELKYYYSAADVFVSTPWYEPFGITPLEAMACGTPVIGSAVGGIKYSVVPGENGFLVPPRRSRALAGKILKTLEQGKRIMGEAGVKRMYQLFTWEKVGASMHQIYEILTNHIQENWYAERQLVAHAFQETAHLFQFSVGLLTSPIIEAGLAISRALKSEHKLLICGNGGSAAESQHFAAELVGRFELPSRSALPALALTTDTSMLTAWSNDVHFDRIFERQVEAFGKANDILFTISTSGQSNNLIHALKKAKELGMTCINLLGKDGGKAAEYGDINITIPSQSTARIQELQLHIIHLICSIVEQRLFTAPYPIDMEHKEEKEKYVYPEKRVPKDEYASILNTFTHIQKRHVS